MKVVVADVLGMCFGVRDALRTISAIGRPEAVTLHGELVHNEVVLDRLRARGFAMADEKGRLELPVTETLVITAHGISNRERNRLMRAGKRLVDTTCPLVRRAHSSALQLQREGFHVLVIGRPGHVEVEGIVGDLHSFEIVAGPDDVKSYSHSRLGIVCQTTTPARLVQAVREAVISLNPHAEIRFVDTVCLPTKEHQDALERLLGRVDAMVIVGGFRSNNTRELVARCQERGVPAYHVQNSRDLKADWFSKTQTVGLTAGTSTLDETIVEVKQALEAMANRA